MIKLLFFASDRSIGLTSLCTTQAQFINRKKSIDIICVAGEMEQVDGLNDEFEKNKIPLKRIQGLDAHSSFMHLAKQIAEIVRTENIEKVHVQNNWQLALIVFVKFILLRKFGLKIIYTLHGYRHNEPVKAIFARIIIGASLFLFAHKVICMSNQLKQKFSFLGKRISVVFLGVEPVYFANYPDNSERKVRLQLVFPAQFRFGKNQDMLIRSIGWLVDAVGKRDVRLFLPGSGQLKERLEKLIDELNLRDIVYLPGLLGKHELAKLYSNSDVVVVTSNNETFGQSIAEGIVMGKCLLTRRVGVACDVIIDGENGLFFDDEEELKKQLIFLYHNPMQLENLKKNSLKNRHKFDWTNIAKEYELLYQ